MNRKFIEALKAHLLQYARTFWPQDLVDAVGYVNYHIDDFAASWKPEPQNNELFGAEGGPLYFKDSQGNVKPVHDEKGHMTAAPASAPNTNPEALRALADDMSLTLEEYFHASEAALRAVAAEKEAQAVPWGWRLVPVEPTEEMCRALFVNLANADQEAQVIKAVIAAAPQAPEASPWRSIETVPKDGTRVDLWCGGERVPDAYWCKGLWYTLQDYCGSLESVPLIYSCTHWTPRPKGPKT